MSKPLKKKAIKASEVQVPEEQGKLRIVGPKDLDSQGDSLGSEFKLKSEFFEKNVTIPEIDRDNGVTPITQVKVYREEGVDVVDPQQLKKFIKENKDIKQVIVEKVSIDEATRVSLLFEPKHHASSENELTGEKLDLLEQFPEEEKETQTEKSFSLDELENLVNEGFINPPKKTSIQDTLDERKDIQESKAKARIQVVSKSPNLSQVEAKGSGHEEKVGESGLNLKLKGSEGKEGALKYEKHSFTRKKSRSGHAYYYRAKDHVELYKVGSSFLKDFNSGLKSFSFSSSGLREEREKSVLGILSFFNYHQDLRICVITNDLKESFYNKIAVNAQKREGQVFDEDLYYEFYTGEGFEIIEFKELKRIEKKITAYNFEDFLDQIMNSFDLVLWDLPEIEILDSNKELYFPVIRSLDSVSFIVGKNVSKISEINEMVSYFKRYQIPIKGLLLSDPHKDEGGKK